MFDMGKVINEEDLLKEKLSVILKVNDEQQEYKKFVVVGFAEGGVQAGFVGSVLELTKGYLLIQKKLGEYLKPGSESFNMISRRERDLIIKAIEESRYEMQDELIEMMLKQLHENIFGK